MGWWSETVMGGDPPLDWRYDFAKLLGVYHAEAETNDEAHAFTRDVVEQNLDKMVKYIREVHDRRPDNTQYINVGWQVFAYIVLKCGAEIPESLRERMIRAAQDDESDSWIDSGLRRAYMKDLIDKLRAHTPGVCVELAEEGLIEKVAELFEQEADTRDIVDRLVSLAAFHGWDLDGERLPALLRRPKPEQH